MQFHYHLIVHQKPVNYNRRKLYKILMSLVNYQTIMKLHEKNLKYYQSTSKKNII
jgi:hypothetical protein